jgi:hypothetical protein
MNKILDDHGFYLELFHDRFDLLDLVRMTINQNDRFCRKDLGERLECPRFKWIRSFHDQF